MSDDEMNRRGFVSAASLALGALAFRPGLASGALVRSAPNVATVASRAVFVRPEIHSPAGLAMVASYQAAVTKMRQWSTANPADPRGWTYQANMHGFSSGAPLPAWATCQHGSFFFISWHRMYLYYFERICREASGNPNFVLPYWDYEPASQRLLPPAFRDATSSLFDPNRNLAINGGTAGIPAADANPALAMAAATFLGTGPAGFGGGAVPGPVHFNNAFGQLELRPHNVVHGDIGGDMGNPNTAARDPIFWLHHANIDRLWSYWRRLDTAHTNPSTAPWTTQTFTFFDEHGTAQTMAGAAVVDTVAQLNYRYDTEPPRINPAILAAASRRIRLNARLQEIIRIFTIPPKPWPPEPPDPWKNLAIRTAEPVVLRGVEAVARVPLPVEDINRLKRAFAAKPRQIMLTLEGLSVSASPGGSIDVFLAGGAESTRKLTSVEQARGLYVGTLDFFALFGLAHNAGGGLENVTLTVDATDVLGPQLARLGRRADALTVMFRFRGPVDRNQKTLAPPRPITVGRVMVHVV